MVRRRAGFARSASSDLGFAEIKRERSRSQSPRRRASPLPARRRSRSDERTKRRHDSFSSQSSDSRDRTPPPKSRHAALMDKLLARIDPENERFVRACAEKVAHHGRAFEDMLRTREVDNPKFAFLRDDQVRMETAQTNGVEF